MLERTRTDALRVLQIEEADAWFEYLESTRNQPELRYDEVERWAYARLKQKLATINTRRRKLAA